MQTASLVVMETVYYFVIILGVQCIELFVIIRYAVAAALRDVLKDAPVARGGRHIRSVVVEVLRVQQRPDSPDYLATADWATLRNVRSKSRQRELVASEQCSLRPRCVEGHRSGCGNVQRIHATPHGIRTL